MTACCAKLLRRSDMIIENSAGALSSSEGAAYSVAKCRPFELCRARLLRFLATACAVLASVSVSAAAVQATGPITTEISFATHDRHAMRGKLTVPPTGSPRAIVIYAQTAEGMTMDMRRPLGRGKSFSYFDLYREKLPAMGVGFFSYEGRGIRNGSVPPRYEEIDWNVYNTSTLENKVRDLLSAMEAVRSQPAARTSPILLMGASEGTLLAADAASRKPSEVQGLILYAVMSDTMRSTFKYIVSDGGFLAYRSYFDTNADGKISRVEFEADPKKYREQVFKNSAFEVFDKDADGDFSIEDMRVLSKRYLDAVDNDNYEVLDGWAKTAAGVVTPQGWFKDHFSHQPIWTFLSKVDVPVGLFHGTADTSTPVDGVRKLQALAGPAGKAKMRFHYFDGLDHTLNIGTYFTHGILPAGHQAIFEFIRERAARN
jgi:pimeloyl-ACP methyl ester carboxylesterase